MTMKIADFEIGSRTFIIAEIGNNHEGDLAAARMLVEKAAECGVDAVKFQTIRADKFVARTEEARFKQITKYELTDDQFRELAELASGLGLYFLSTPFDTASVDMLENLVPAYKIASGDLTWPQLLEYAACKGKPVLLATGMSNEAEITSAVETIKSASPLPDGEQLVLLHCVSSYPVPVNEANLLSIPYLRQTYRVPVGYSDHTIGIQACQTAVALGACVIEKHFTYRKEDQTFRDHALSADPDDMKALVESIRSIEASLGNYDIVVTEAEDKNRAAMRRSLAAARNIRQGEAITAEAVTFLRPGTGIPPAKLPRFLGRRVRKDIVQGHLIMKEDIDDR